MAEQPVEDIFAKAGESQNPKSQKPRSQKPLSKKVSAPVPENTEQASTSSVGDLWSRYKMWLMILVLIIIVGVVVAVSGVLKPNTNTNTETVVTNMKSNTASVNGTTQQTAHSLNITNTPLDTDGDGLSDDEEISLGTDSNKPDTDSDGLFDREEVKVYKTNPLKKDTDGDGYTDGDEVQSGNNPNGSGKLLDLQTELNRLK
jgi:anti-sigma-K factor RskA